MFNYKITIAYDGTNYSGWQKQPNGMSIQEVLEKALKIPLRKEINIIGAGRTDAGVHAKGQVAHFFCEQDINFVTFLISINAILPKDIRIKDIEKVPDDFHARYSARGKIYRYYLCLDDVQDPFWHRYSYHVFKNIDLTLLQKAAQKIVGTHNFTSFGNVGGATKGECIRTIKRLDIIPWECGVYLEFEGPGFLYKMVRNIVGTLLEVARKKRPLDDIEKVFEAKNRCRAGQTAAARGLVLFKVIFG
jgi:tRNA pseudouridine38-40 synthase